MDPDGRDIIEITALGIGIKLVIGAGVTVGIAFDSDLNFATVINGNIGFGLEVGADTPIAPSISVNKDINFNDLNSFGPYRYYSSTTITASAEVGIIFDYSSNEIIGGTILAVGGGVDKNFTLYFDFSLAKGLILDAAAKAGITVEEFLSGTQELLSPEAYDALIELLLE